MKQVTQSLSHIVVAVDFSEPSRSATTMAAEIALHHGARLHLLNVVNVFVHFSVSPSATKSYHDDRRADAERDLQALSEELQRRFENIDVTVAARVGQPAPTIVDYAESVNADLIVLGSQGSAADGRFTIGSVAMAVARDATRPVMLTTQARAQRAKDGWFRNPLVAVDYSKMTRPAATLALALANKGSTVELLHVIHAPVDTQDEVTQALLEAAREADLRALDDLAGNLDIAEISTRTRSEVGSVAQEILSFIENSAVDLVVVGAHSRDDSIDVIGTIADRIARCSPVPVVVIPNRARR